MIYFFISKRSGKRERVCVCVCVCTPKVLNYYNINILSVKKVKSLELTLIPYLLNFIESIIIIQAEQKL